jgi:queuosine precursor transporter
MNAKAIVSKVLTGKTPWSYLYLALIPFVNWSFEQVPSLALSTGGNWNPVTIITGLILVVRDFAQREVGHYIFGFLGLGLILSVITSDPTVALASACAFAVSETIDWALFTFAKLPLSKRIFVSSAISGPIDAAVFLWIASFSIPGIFNIWSILAATLSRIAGCYIIYLLMRHRETKNAKLSA